MALSAGWTVWRSRRPGGLRGGGGAEGIYKRFYRCQQPGHIARHCRAPAPIPAGRRQPSVAANPAPEIDARASAMPTAAVERDERSNGVDRESVRSLTDTSSNAAAVSQVSPNKSRGINSVFPFISFPFSVCLALAVFFFFFFFFWGGGGGNFMICCVVIKSRRLFEPCRFPSPNIKKKKQEISCPQSANAR